VFSPELVDERILNRLTKQAGFRQSAVTFLFTGEEVEKKKALALAFAKALNCSNAANPVLMCECSICARIEKGAHPDVKWYGLDEDANSIKIQEAREFRNWLSLKPFEGKIKVGIFNAADRLTPESQNALLKSLEEPPPGNVIILLVSQARSLFDTIVSRSIEIKIPPFAPGEVERILIKEGAEREEASFLARVSGGSLVTAKLAREERWYEERKKWVDQLTANPRVFLEQSHTSTRNQVMHVFDFMIEWVRDLLVFQAMHEPSLTVHSFAARKMEQIAQARDFRSICDLFENMTEIRKSIDENANQKLALTQTEIILEQFFNKGPQ